MGGRLKPWNVASLDRLAMFLDCRRCGAKGERSEFCHTPSGRKMRVPHAERLADSAHERYGKQGDVGGGR